MTRLPRVFRLDPSDLSVFDVAAEPGEWAVPGSFSFLDGAPLTGKRRAAFANGFLGAASFGWTTLVTVDDASDAEVEAVVASLATHFVLRHGAPSTEEAEAVARREVAFASSICAHPHRHDPGDQPAVRWRCAARTVQNDLAQPRPVRPPRADRPHAAGRRRWLTCSSAG